MDFEIEIGDFFKSGKVPSIKNMGVLMMKQKWIVS